MIQLVEYRQRPYFVDNDFFKNKYSMVGNLKYFCIKQREITEWEKYSQEYTIKENNNKILYFLDYKK